MFLRKIMHAIARLLTPLTQHSDKFVQPIQSAGRANKARTQPSGNKRSAQTSTKPRKPVTKKSSSKRSAVQSTTVASSRKAEPKPAQTTSGKRGRPRKTPV